MARRNFNWINGKDPAVGGGDTRVVEDGKVIAKGGVNFSAVYGELPENISTSPEG